MDWKGVDMADVIKGRVLSVVNNCARLEPLTEPGRVSPLIPVPDELNGLMDKNTEVAYVVFGDATGIILGKIDSGEGGSKE